MIKVTVLGTSGASPTKQRNLTSVALAYDGNVLLFDCGEGTQTQILRYGVNSSRIRAIFVSHAHGDHVIGIAGLVRTLSLNGRREPLLICVPKGSEPIIKSLIGFDKVMLTYPIAIKGVKGGMVYKGKDFTVSAFKLNHTIPTYGYVFKIDDKRRFIEQKARKLGLVGEMYSILQKKGKLKLGRKTIRLNDITRIKVGKKIVYASDTRPTSTTVKAAKDADLLLHESTYADREKRLARQRGHSTAYEAAAIARKAGVKQLALIHFSARYTDMKQIEADAKKEFENVLITKDGDEIYV